MFDDREKTILSVLLVVLFVLLPFPAWATEVPTSTAPTMESLAVLLIIGVGASAVSLVTLGVKKVLPSIPRILLPTLVIPTLGILAEFVATLAMGSHYSPIVAACMTTMALYLRESWDTAKKHGFDPVQS
jgi:hypothetical protein